MKLCARCRELNEDQRDPQECNDCVCASSDGEKGSPHPSNTQIPSKKASPKKVTSVWCDDCTRLKTQPGEGGRTRKNAKYRCQKCAALREKAGLTRGKKPAGSSPTPDSQGTSPAKQARPGQGNSLPTPAKTGTGQAFTRKSFSVIRQRNHGQTAQPGSSKSWKLAVGSKQQQEQNRGFDPSTESDDPDNLPKPNRSNPQVDDFGKPRDHSETTRQVLENVRRWNAQPPAAAFSGPNFFNEDRESNQSSRYGNDTQTMRHTPQMDNFMSYPMTGNASGPQQQHPGEESRGFFLFPPEPPTYPGATTYPDPDPMELDTSRTFNAFNEEDTWNLWSSNASVPLYPSNLELPGLPSTGNTAGPNQMYSNPFAASSPPPSNFPGMPGPANPAPAYPSGSQRHPGLRPGSTDPTLSEAPRQPAASPPPLDPGVIDPRLLELSPNFDRYPAPDPIMPDSAELSQNNGWLTFETEEDLYSA